MIASRTFIQTQTNPIPIADLHADIVPHCRWATRKWYYANPLWYYHRPGMNGELNANRKFYDLVDDDLKCLCHVLHECSIHTTPSCQGHFYGRQHFQQVWDELVREAQTICADGLIVKDCETDQPYKFMNPRYGLPWQNFDEFYDQAQARQHLGYLGVIVPYDRSGLYHTLRNETSQTDRARIVFDEALSSSLHGWMFHIVIKPHNPHDRLAQWTALTQYFDRLLTPASP